MQFQSLAQKESYGRVAPWLLELFGPRAIANTELPVFDITVGSALVRVRISPWGDDDAIITTRAVVVTRPEITPDLMHFLLRSNDKMRFGAFGIDAEGNIIFEHTIVGLTCDKTELKSSVMAVITTADQYDEQIIGRWGGEKGSG